MKLMHQPELYFDASTSFADGKLTDSTAAFLKYYLEMFEKWIND
jgi:hypothetical protein